MLDGGAELGQARVDRAFSFAHLLVDLETLGQVLLLGDLEAHDLTVGIGLPIKREAGGVGAPMLQRLKHRGHLLSDVAALAPMDEPGNSAHENLLLSSFGPRYGKQSQ